MTFSVKDPDPTKVGRRFSAAVEMGLASYPGFNLRALNFVLRGFLGDGVAASLATDAQGKALGEHLLAREAPIPLALLKPPIPNR